MVLSDTPSRHRVVQYTVDHKKPAGYQRKCVIRGQHTSYCCASRGENCPAHPARTRLGVQYSYLQEHREDPNFAARGATSGADTSLRAPMTPGRPCAACRCLCLRRSRCRCRSTTVELPHATRAGVFARA